MAEGKPEVAKGKPGSCQSVAFQNLINNHKNFVLLSEELATSTDLFSLLKANQQVALLLLHKVVYLLLSFTLAV